VKQIFLSQGITSLYPPQEEAIKKGALNHENLVLAIPTASGKTLVAELAMLKSIIEEGGKALYLVPLRALANEKYDEFKKYEQIGVKVAVSTGDYDSSDKWLENYDIIICSVDYNEPIVIKENGAVKSIRIGEFVDKLMEKSNKITFTNGCEVLDISDLNYETLAFDPQNYRIGFKKIRKIIRHKITEPLYKLYLETEREITVTSSHSVYVLENLNIKAKRVSEIQVGDYVLIPRRLPVQAIDTKSKISPFTFAQIPETHPVCMLPADQVISILKHLNNKLFTRSTERISREHILNMLNSIKIKILDILTKHKKLNSRDVSLLLKIHHDRINPHLRFLSRKGLIKRNEKINGSFYSISEKGLALLGKIKKLKRVLNSDFAFAKVKKINQVSSSSNYVYDISVPGCENFIAGLGGVICHNTNEKADSLLRHHSPWLNKLTVIVADEIHLINDPHRGPTLEVVLARLRQVNPNAQFLALCLDGDTLVYPENSNPVRISELVENEFSKAKRIRKILYKGREAIYIEPCRQIKILSINDKFVPEFREVIGLWKVKHSKLYRIRLQSGREIRLTEDTPILGFNGKNIKWLFPYEIKKGMYLPFLRKITSKKSKVPTITLIKRGFVETDSEILSWLRTARKGYGTKGLAKILKVSTSRVRSLCGGFVKNIRIPYLLRLANHLNILPRVIQKVQIVKSRNGKKCSIPRYITPDLMYYAGLVGGDGNIDRGRRIRIKQKEENKSIIEIFCSLTWKLFKLKAKKRKKGDFIEAWVNSGVIADILENIGIPSGSKSSIIRPMNFLYSISEEHLKAYISGWFDAEGYVSSKERVIGFSIASQDIAKSLAQILLELGIMCYLGRDGRKYRIYISNRESLLKFSEIGFRNSRKNKLLRNLLAKLGGGASRVGIPSTIIPLKKLRKRPSLTQEELGRKINLSRGVIGHYERGNHIIPFETFQKLLKIKGVKEFLKNSSWINDNIIWLKVKDIEVINADGWKYDLCVRGTHRFIANNLIVHNSATIKNAEEIADWLNAKLVLSNWRPVILKEGIYDGEIIEFNDGTVKKPKRFDSDPTVSLAIDTVYGGGQSLVFLSTRRSAVSMATRTAKILPKFLSKSLQRTLTEVADEILRRGTRTQQSEKLAELVKRGVAFHHAGLHYEHRKIIEDTFRQNIIKIICATPTLAAGVNLPARRVIIRDYYRYESDLGHYPIPILEYKQQAGRAGRPKYDKVGEAILIAKSEEEKRQLFETYIFGEPEKIWSKLANEQALRTHVLSTISAGYANSEKSLLKFINETFYAYQYDPEDIRSIIKKILNFLTIEKLLVESDHVFLPTPLGKRTSELYIDPLTTVIIREGLLNAKKEKITPISILHLISHTPDMVKLYLRRKDYQKFMEIVDLHHSEFLVEVPDYLTQPTEYEWFLSEVKVAQLLQDWIDEKTEDEILQNYGIGSGDLLRIVETADWLLYAAEEIAKIIKRDDLISKIWKIRQRVKHGVKEELLELVRLKGIGRVRARILYRYGFKSIFDLQKATTKELLSLPLIGPEIVKNIKKQIGGNITESDITLLKKEEKKQKRLTDYS